MPTDFTPPIVTLVIEFPDGRVEHVPVQLPSYHDFHQIDADIPEPDVPYTRIEHGQPALNPDDPAYLTARAEALTWRQRRRLVQALVRGGHDLPGATLAEQTDWFFTQADAGLVHALLGFFNNATLGGRARIDARAVTFQSLRAGADAHLPAQWLDAAPVGVADGR